MLITMHCIEIMDLCGMNTAKRILGVLLLGAMGYLAYIKIDQNMGNSDYAGFFLFLLVVAVFIVVLVVRKILTY